MSTPPSAEKKTVSEEPLVTPAASAHRDCSSSLHPRRDLLVHHQQGDPQQHEVPSPSRAESPAQHFNPLKKSSKPSPLDFHRPHTPQLSERDSIFATNYLPSDSEPTPLPSHPCNDAPPPYNLNPHLPNAFSGPDSTSSKVLPHRLRNEAAHMEVEVPRNDPFASLLRPPFLSPPVTTHAALLSATAADDRDRDVNDPVVDKTAPTSIREGSQPFPEIPQYPDRGLIPSAISPQPVPRDGQETSVSEEPRESLRDGGCDMNQKFERSSSRNRRGMVESSIEANLANAEPASHVRSRKSSHYLGLFKENTASPERKRKDDRAWRPEEAWGPSDESPVELLPGTGAWSSEEDVDSQRDPRNLSNPSFPGTPVMIEPSPGSETLPQLQTDDLVKYQFKALPRSLLEEIRNFHLTPGGARGSSFSKSIPRQFTEGGHDYTQEQPLGDAASPVSGTLAEQRREPVHYEDDDEENEQISSAVYYPHERVTVSDEADPYKPPADNQGDLQPYEAEAHPVLLPGKEHDLPGEQEVSHVDISLRSKNDSRILHGHLQDLQAPLEELNEKPLTSISERSHDSTCESEAPSADESGLSTHEESSVTEDDGVDDMTPTATPVQRNRYMRHGRKHGKVAPVGAVELKPYRHQVGGHTTVFRFSRRAVCKQLNNRENEFYERIERRHPEMLMFLPRCVDHLCWTQR